MPRIDDISAWALGSLSGGGTILSGDLALGVVLAEHIASGQVGLTHLTSQVAVLLGGGISGVAQSLSSGSVTSGYIGNAAVVSGSVASGSLSAVHLASGTIPPGGAIASGSVQSGHLGDATVVAGSLAAMTNP